MVRQVQVASDEEGEGSNHKRYKTGAMRTTDADNQRFDALSPEALRRIAVIHAEGIEKYGLDNYRKGMPFTETLNHAMRHLNLYLSGDRQEDHLAKAAWGLHTLMEFEITHPEQDDLYFSPVRWKAQGE